MPIEIIGVNAKTEASGNAGFVAGIDLPWLQDTEAANVWTSWQVNWRDVIVLDGENKVVRVYNLTDYDLSVPANYNGLRTILLDAAGPAALTRAGARRR